MWEMIGWTVFGLTAFGWFVYGFGVALTYLDRVREGDYDPLLNIWDFAATCQVAVLWPLYKWKKE